MKVLTSFTAHNTGEGQRISYTYSIIDETGKLIEQNVRESFIVIDEDLQAHIDAIKEDISDRLES